MAFIGKTRPLSAQGIANAAGTLGVDPPALWAVLTVETSGCGFLPDRRPKILFERHWFSRLTNHRFDDDPSGISNPVAGGYGAGGAPQYDRLALAMALDADAALQSTSWGLGQIMGFNATKAGCANVKLLVAQSQDGEDGQLAAMVAFVQEAQLADSLRRGDWAQFALRYNGQDFQKNKYDQKLDLFHKRYLQGPLPDLTVRGVQLALMVKQFGGNGFVDGWFGAATQRALMRYQQQAGLPASGAIDSATQAQLWADLGW